jgi:acyl dehydratase
VTVEAGTPLPEWTLDAVDPAPMKVYAAIARDPNPIHWDRGEVAKRGLGERLINQGPLSLGYVVNMLHAWVGPGSLRGLTVRFTAPVRDGDTVTAGGTVTAVRAANGDRLADCDVWLARADGTRAVEGTATVTLPGSAVA